MRYHRVHYPVVGLIWCRGKGFDEKIKSPPKRSDVEVMS